MKCESTIQHSQIVKFFFKIATATLFGLMATCVIPLIVHAQMFSVGNQGQRFNTPQTELYFGVEPLDVTYRGGNNLGPQRQGGAFAFNGSILRLGYRSEGLDLFLGTGGQITGISDVSYFDIGGNIDIGLTLQHSKRFLIQIPIRISSRYTNMTNDQNISSRFNRFKFGSLTGGAGLHVMARPSDNVRIEVSGVPSYGAAFASGGFFGGSVALFVAEGRVYFDRLFGNLGLSVGYKYDYRNYDVDENIYDYKMSGNNIEVGVTF